MLPASSSRICVRAVGSWRATSFLSITCAAHTAIPSASSAAFATAAAGPSIGISPTPFAPDGPNGYGTSTMMVSSSGASANVGTMQLVMFAFATRPSLYTTFSSTAQPSACSVPPSICPLTIDGLIALPTSTACTQRRIATSQVSRSTSTSTRHAAQPYTGYAEPVYVASSHATPGGGWYVT